MREALYKELEKLGRYSVLITTWECATYAIHASKVLLVTGSEYWSRKECSVS